jgi:hypothetical protein
VEFLVGNDVVYSRVPREAVRLSPPGRAKEVKGTKIALRLSFFISKEA